LLKEVMFLTHIEKSIAIRASPERVWEMLAFDRAPDWMGDLAVSGQYTSEVHTLDDKFKVGATGYSSTHSGMGGNLEIAESLKHEKMASRVTSGMMSAVGTYSLEPTNEGTTVNYVFDYRFNSFL
jgi:carbon monoxide dehydrogenase subunit G